MCHALPVAERTAGDLAARTTTGPAWSRTAPSLVERGRIVYAGRGDTSCRCPGGTCERIDCGGRLITPALIDCHTHLVHGGNRAREFEQRLAGATYEQIARAGGGILSTVRATNALRARTNSLAQALPRLDALLAEGVGTVEIKSGYGLNIEAELKMLRVARRLETLRPVRIRTTLPRRPRHAAGIRRAQRRIISTESCCPAWRRLTRGAWWMPWTASAKASRFRPTRCGGCSTGPRGSACR